MIAIPVSLWPSDVIAPPAGATLLKMAGETMGTGWSVLCYPASRGQGEHLRARIAAELDRLVLQMSQWREDSDLSRFNRALAGEWVKLPTEFLTVLTAALAVALRSDGAFNPALGRHVNQWGFGPSGPRTEPPLAPLGSQAGDVWRDIRINGGEALQPGGAALDLSAIAKGFAVDHIAELLNQEGLVSYLVEIGGELRARGVRPNRQPWWVSVESPPGCTLEIKVALSGWAIATSGDYRRYFEHQGRRYAHTLDPRSGQPVDDPPASVSVLHTDCMAADAWATALMVLGQKRGLELCEREKLAAVFLFRDQPLSLQSRCFREMLS